MRAHAHKVRRSSKQWHQYRHVKKGSSASKCLGNGGGIGGDEKMEEFLSFVDQQQKKNETVSGWSCLRERVQ